MWGGDYLVPASTTDTRVSQNSSLPPKDQPIPWSGEGAGNQRASTSVEELSHLRNLQLARHITCRNEKHKTARTGMTENSFPRRRAPGLIGHHQLQASGLELRFLWAQVHWCFLSRNLFVFMYSHILHFNAAYWPFRYFIFLFWSQGVFVDFLFYYYFVVGRTSEIKWLEKCVRFRWLLNTTSLLLPKTAA